jgi:hypothetical protein
MTENNKAKTRGISIKSPRDVQKICRRVIGAIFEGGSEVEDAQKINQLCLTWLRAWELLKVSDLEKRVIALEKERRRD